MPKGWAVVHLVLESCHILDKSHKFSLSNIRITFLKTDFRG
jgi:hypothetical protein